MSGAPEPLIENPTKTKLGAEGIATTEVVGKYRFTRLTGEGLRFLCGAVDLLFHFRLIKKD